MISSKSLDLCVSFDDTGSMSSVRKLVRQQIKELTTKLFADISDLRVSIIIHNDYCDSPNHIYVLDFTTDLNKIEKFIEQYSPCGGGDAPECYELALHEATKLSWNSPNRAMVLIGDEVPHEVGYRCYVNGGTHINNISWKTEIANLANMKVKVYGVQALNRRSANTFYETISNKTNGIKLELSQFNHIVTYINAIAYKQSGGLDEYEQSNSTFTTNMSIKNMFSKLRGHESTISSDKLDLLSKFQVMNVDTDGETSIRDFVMANGCTFKKGKGYYQLVLRKANGEANNEKLQEHKEVIFVNKETGDVNSDTADCRNKLGIPLGTRGNIKPLQIRDLMDQYDIFIQSTSVNRKLDAGVKFLYELDHV